MKRREFIGLVACAAFAAPVASMAQSRVRRVGALVLTDTDAESFGRELREGLREFGYIQGQNLQLDIRSAAGNASLLPQLAAELVRARVEVIAAVFTPCALAAKQATSEIPILMIAVADPVGTGLVASLSRPGGNVTGVSNMGAETAGKSVELFRDLLPSLKRIGVLANPVDPFTKPFLEQIRQAGRTTGVEIAPVAMVRGADEVDAAFADMSRSAADAVIVQGIFFSKTIVDLAIKHRLPSASVVRSFADAGGLMAYGADMAHLYGRGANLVHRILQGANPADLPVELPTKFDLAINMRTARLLGLTVPGPFLARADAVID